MGCTHSTAIALFLLLASFEPIRKALSHNSPRERVYWNYPECPKHHLFTQWPSGCSFKSGSGVSHVCSSQRCAGVPVFHLDPIMHHKYRCSERLVAVAQAAQSNKWPLHISRHGNRLVLHTPHPVKINCQGAALWGYPRVSQNILLRQRNKLERWYVIEQG